MAPKSGIPGSTQYKKIWREAFIDLTNYGPPYRFNPRQLAGLYAVASICYHGNSHSVISDEVFDNLCKWLRVNLEKCKSEGADKLDINLLECNSGYDVSNFVRPYHNISGILLGHPCQCMICTQ